MKATFTKLIFVTFILNLVSCGSSSNDGETPTVALSLSFSPTSVSSEVQEGLKVDWKVTATVQGTSNEQVYVKIVDSYGIISDQEDDLLLTQVNSINYTLELRSNPNLEAGEHTSNLNVHLCKNTACNEEYTGSPWSIPITLNVISNTNLTALTNIANYAGWSRGNVHLNNSQFVPVTLTPEDFSSRWLRESPLAELNARSSSISQFVTQDKVLAFVEALDSSNNDPDTRHVVGLSEDTGEILWRSKLDEEETITQSFAQSTGFTVITNYASFNTFDVQTGASLRSQVLPIDTYFSTYTGTMIDDKLYIGGIYEHHNRIFAYDYELDIVEWSINNNSFSYGEESTIVADETYVYYYDAGRGLVYIDRESGQEIKITADPDASNGKKYGAAILGDDVIVTLTPTHTNGPLELGVYDLPANQISWTVIAEFIFSPVIKNQELIIGSTVEGTSQEFTIQSYDLNNGEVNWQATIPTNSFDKYNMIVTENLIFVGLEHETIAFDIVQQSVVWRYPRGGELAISGHGTLYINNPNNRTGLVNAINLR